MAGVVAVALVPAALLAASGAGQDGAAGDRIVFQSDRDGDWELFVANADGTGERPVTANTRQDTNPSWAPPAAPGTPQRIAFESDADGDPEIYVVADDGSGLRQLTDNATADTAPAWSPDGTEIAFAARRAGRTDLYVVNADGTAERRLTTAAGDEAAPAWSPDSSQVAFSRDRRRDSGIFVIARDGRGERRVTSGAAVDAHPSWFRFADGTGMIAFDRLQRLGGDYEISRVDLADGSVARLSISDAQDLYPDWSPAGETMAFATDRDGNLELYEMAGDGSAQRRLTVSRGNDTAPDYLRVVRSPAGPPAAPRRAGGGCRGGGPGDNRYVGSSRPDRICGGGGHDRIRGLAGADILWGDDGRDRLRGGPGRDFLRADDGFGGDVVRGGPGADSGSWDPGDTPRSVTRQR